MSVPKILYLDPNYDEKFLDRNTSLTLFIIEKATKKVANVCVVERRALVSWFDTKKQQYPSQTHAFLCATNSIMGELLDIDDGSGPRYPIAGGGYRN